MRVDGPNRVHCDTQNEFWKLLRDRIKYGTDVRYELFYKNGDFLQCNGFRKDKPIKAGLMRGLLIDGEFKCEYYFSVDLDEVEI